MAWKPPTYDLASFSKYYFRRIQPGYLISDTLRLEYDQLQPKGKVLKDWEWALMYTYIKYLEGESPLGDYSHIYRNMVLDQLITEERNGSCDH